jgi:hypothetical protein
MRYRVLLLPKINERTTSTKKIKNRILAMLAAPAAIPPNPNIAAMTAKTIKIIVQRNMVMCILGYYLINCWELLPRYPNNSLYLIPNEPIINPITGKGVQLVV